MSKLKNFFKPNEMEWVVMGWEVPFVSFPIKVGASRVGSDPIEALAYALAPQALTYAAGRIYDLCTYYKTRK